jgi:NADPH:quinone reductase-like Zn-dependent oxidoreductase
LLDVVVPEPRPGPRYLLIDIRAISINPAGTKVRQSAKLLPGEKKFPARLRAENERRK